MDINTAVPATEGMTQGAVETTADNIMIAKEDGSYDTYFLSNGKNAKGQAISGLAAGTWVKNGATTVPATVEIKSGTAFWYRAANTTTPYTITVAGQVLSAASDTLDITKNYTLVGSPYPCDLPLNDKVVVSEGATQGAVETAADNLMIAKDDGTYDTYFLSNGKNAKGQAISGLAAGTWVKNGATTVATTDSIPAGKGAWFVSQSGNAKLLFKSPLTNED